VKNRLAPDSFFLGERSLGRAEPGAMAAKRFEPKRLSWHAHREKSSAAEKRRADEILPALPFRRWQLAGEQLVLAVWNRRYML
jgi:hypothetical protein